MDVNVCEKDSMSIKNSIEREINLTSALYIDSVCERDTIETCCTRASQQPRKQVSQLFISCQVDG